MRLIFKTNKRLYLISLLVLISGFSVISYYRGPAPYEIPLELKKFLKFPVNYTNPIVDTNELVRFVDEMNSGQSIKNLDLYDNVGPDTKVIVISVGRDAERLQYLIVSLAEVQFICTALLVFSHRFYDPNINKLIEEISFCKVKQIFFPFSIQLYPHKFPGVDPMDCRSDKPQNKIISFCADRDAAEVQQKHHWWWTVNFVFEQMNLQLDNDVIFLEEDNYVARDLLYMQQNMKRARTFFPHLDITSFGNSDYKGSSFDLVTVDAWTADQSLGLAFNKITWQKMLDNTKDYCMINDSKWNSSLFNLFRNFPGGYAQVLSCVEPRVLSTKNFTSGREAATQLRKTLHEARLFPAKVRSVVELSGTKEILIPYKLVPQPDGRFSDVRDQLLCLDPLLMTTTLQYNQEYLTSTTVSTQSE